MDYVAVSVAAANSVAPDESLRRAIDAAGLTATKDIRSLGARAAEVVISRPTDANLADLRNALAIEAVDSAIIPAGDRRKMLLVCDMDSTIIQQECLDELADFAGLKSEISAITERAMRGELNFEDALTHRVAMLKGLPISAIADCYSNRIDLSEGARTLVATMTQNGARCLLVSGGFTAFTAKVAKAAGFHEHYANELLHDGSTLTGKVADPILGREAKLQTLSEAAAQLGLSLKHSLAMGDGANDLAMINAAGLGIAYRAKPVVAAAADAAIDHSDLRAALFFQGYTEDEFVTP
ncbi:MAG: phosphoserine phosphatase SerB [Pseudomonadota bacterium]